MNSFPKFLRFGAAFVLIGALFPWMFMFKGDVFGIAISVRSLGALGGVGLMVAGLACFFSAAYRARLMDLARDLDGRSAAMKASVVLMAAALYLILVVSQKFRAHALLSTHAYDLGFFSNICWNTAHGNWFWSSELERNFMAVHVNWILWPLAFFYGFGGDAHVLLAAQAAFVAVSIPLVWLLVRHITGSFSAGLLGALLFVCSPYINHSASNDFHPDLWLLPCLMGSLLCWRTNKPAGTIALALLAILAKEDVSIVVCGWGLVLFIDRWRWTGAILMAASLTIFLFQTQIFIPQFLDGSEKSLLFYRYAFLKEGYRISAPLFLTAIVHEPMKYARLAAYLVPVGGLTCLAPLFLIPPIISVLPHILSQAVTQLDLADIYSMPAQPFLFCGAAFGSMAFYKRFGPAKTGALASVLIFIAGAGLLKSPSYFQSKNLYRLDAFKEMETLIPKNASLLAQQNLYPHFDTRRLIQIFPDGNSFTLLKTAYLTNPDFVVCDRIGSALPFDGPFLAKSIASLEADPRYEKIFDKKDLVVFKRTKEEPLRWRTVPRPTT
jgi:uncharacterized membrane protein